MRPAKTLALALLGLALLWSAPSAGESDGWYKWQVEEREATLFVLKKDNRPERIHFRQSDCQFWSSGRQPIGDDVTDMGSLSLEDSVTMLLDIAKSDDLDMRVREQAMHWLAQSDSDAAYAYINAVLFDG